MEHEQDLHIYPPKIKNFMWFIVLLFISIILIWNVNNEINEGYLFSAILLIICSLLAILMMMVPFKWMTTDKPYMTLTEESITIRRFLRRPVTVEWRNIHGYQIRDKTIRRLIDIITFQQYSSSKGKSIYEKLYPIAWGQIREEDRKILVQELERRTDAPTNLYHLLYGDHPTPKAEEVLTKDYWMKSYALSLGLSIFAFIILSLDGWGLHFLLAALLYFILYPLTKAMVDMLFHFIFYRKQDQLPPFLKSVFSKMILPLHLLAFPASIFLAPISIVFLIVTVMRARKASG